MILIISKKGFIIIIIALFSTTSFLFFYLKSKIEIIRDIFLLTEAFIQTKYKKNIMITQKNCNNPPKKGISLKISHNNIVTSKNTVNNFIIISTNKQKENRKDLKYNIEERNKFGMKITFRDIKKSKSV